MMKKILNKNQEKKLSTKNLIKKIMKIKKKREI